MSKKCTLHRLMPHLDGLEKDYQNLAPILGLRKPTETKVWDPEIQSTSTINPISEDDETGAIEV